MKTHLAELGSVILLGILYPGFVDAQSLPDALNPTLEWSTGGNTPWEVSTDISRDGLGARSGLIAAGQESWVQTTITGPTEVRFWWKTSTVTSSPFQLLIGGILQTELAGNAGVWQARKFFVPAGPQTIQWRFLQKVTSSTEQRGWLDEVSTNMATAPDITTGPANRAVPAGESFTLQGIADGTEPLTFSWLKDGIVIPNALSSSLKIDDAQLKDQANYELVVQNPLGVVTSQVASVTVEATAPQFTQQPVSLGAAPYTTALFSAAAKGSQPISWQWYANELPLANQVQPSLMIANVGPANYADYFAVISNSWGMTTSAVVQLVYSPVIAWGDNSAGQNIVPAGATNVIALCGGDYHCLALRDDGGVAAWGMNTWAGFKYSQATVPPEATNVIAIAAGSAHSLAARRDGTVVKWGYILTSDLPAPSDLTNVVSLAVGCGAQHALALRADGTVVEWGSTNYNLVPVPPEATNVVSVAAGAYHSLALRGDGTVISWGRNSFLEGPQVVPKSATNVVAIATGWYYNLALRADGKVVGWGARSQASPPNIPSSATNLINIACGSESAIALKRDGSLLTWGNIPTGTTSALRVATNIVAVAGTRNGMLALRGDGPPRLNLPILDRVASAGSNAFFTASAVGSWPLNYQWQFNGTDIAGATNRWVTIPNAQISNDGLYSVTVSNSLGTAVSPAARLQVISPAVIEFKSVAVGPEGFHFTAGGTPGIVWDIQISSDLKLWTPLTTVTNVTGEIDFTDSNPASTQMFYRLRKSQ